MDKNKLVDLIADKLLDNFEYLYTQWNNPKDTLTKHFVLDDLLPENVVLEINSAFPRDADGFYSRKSFREKKKTSANLAQYDQILSDITYAIQDPRVVALIGKITSIDSLEPDPKLYAGGLSMMFKDDYLNPHIDNSHDGERERYRRLNLLFYVSKGWKLENGGNFELWDESRLTPKTIVSKFNRLVVMETNKSSWHSVSQVMVEQVRCCVSNYYFSMSSPEFDNYYHVTSFFGRPDQKFKIFLGFLDNKVRNFISSKFNISRGKNLINNDNNDF